MKIATDSHFIEFFSGINNQGGDNNSYIRINPKKGDQLAIPRQLKASDELLIRQGPNNSMNVIIGNEDMGSVNSDNVNSLAELASQWRIGLSALEADTEHSLPTRSRSLSKSLALDLSSHRNEIMLEKTMRLRVMSWNMHGVPISKEDLTPLTGIPIFSDIYVVGLQESDPLAKNLYANTTTLENTKQAFLDTLGGDYEVISQNQLLGLLMVVICSKQIKQYIDPDINIMSTGTGLLGVWGNKGAICISLTIGKDPLIENSGTQLTLVNCHLSAIDGTPGIDRRQWELQEICKKFRVQCHSTEDILLFDQDASEISSEIVIRQQPDGPKLKQTAKTERKIGNQIILFGDLNYRTMNLHSKFVSNFIAKEDYETILDHDGLQIQMKEHKILNGYKEGKITFAPTFKYNTEKPKGNTAIDDKSKFVNNSSRSNNQQQKLNYEMLDLSRTPSYTDRILCHGDMLTNTGYSSYPQYSISDHKPVVGDFELAVEVVDPLARKGIVDQKLRDNDLEENSLRPIVSVDPPELNVTGELFEPTICSELFLRNCSNGTCKKQLEWICLVASSEFVVEPTSGILPVGADQKIKIATSFAIERKQIEDIAIIKIADGQDIFVPLHFEALPSCIGVSLDLLCRMPNGVRKGMVKDATDSLQNTNMPKEIWNCVDYLWTRIRPDMFEKSGVLSICKQVQAWMDNGDDFDSHVLDTANEIEDGAGIFSVASQLLLLLRNIQGGIISVKYFDLVLRGRDGMNIALESMQGVNVNVLIYLCSFLKKAIEDSVSKENLLDLFEPILITQPLTKLSSKAKIKKREFLLALIE